jgi:hypothetical protein
MAIVMCPCPTCNERTPHQTEGVHTRLREPDGRVSQMMQCVVCKTSTRVYFTEGTDEFQINLDLPNNSDA